MDRLDKRDRYFCQRNLFVSKKILKEEVEYEEGGRHKVEEKEEEERRWLWHKRIRLKCNNNKCNIYCNYFTSFYIYI